MCKRTTFLLGVLFSTFLLPLLGAAQTDITGQVISKADQSPVPGASILIKGSRIGTATGLDGRFTIHAKQGDVLLVTGVGVVPQEVPVGASGEISIAVATNSRNLNEVVVTATGIRKNAKRLGYATQTIDASTLTKAREADPINSLKGNAAGLTININQEIGHAPDVIMRGENGPNDGPMYVVDGVPISSDTYNVNADDIETFTILKGPSAAALYGFRGKNGAIIISTKKGTKNSRGFSVDLNSSTQLNSGFIALPKYQDEYGAGDNGTYAFGGGGGGPQTGPGGGGVGVNDYDYDIWGPQFKGQLLPQYDGVYSPTQTYTTNFPNGATPFVGHIAPTPWVARGKDNLKHFIQTGVLSSNSIAVSASSEKTDMRFSLGNTYQKGLFPNTELNNINFTGNITARLSDKFTVSTYFNYSRQSSPNIPDVTYGANSPIYNIILWGGADWNIQDMKDYWQPGKVGIQQKYEEYFRYNNPYFVSHEWLHGHYVNNVYGYISLNYKINDQIDLQLRPGVTSYDLLNTEKLPFSANTYGRYTLHQGDYREDRRSLFESNVDAQARYHQNQLLGFLDVQGLIGANVRSFNFTSNFESTNYLNTPGIYSFSNSLNPLLGTSFNSEMKVLSAYYSADIGYKSYLTANITGRADKSSSLPPNSDTYFYPSFSLATVISDYVKLPEPVSFFKLRASYAESKDGGTYTFFAPPPLVLEGSTYGYNAPSPYGGPGYITSKIYSLSPTYNNQNSASYTNQTVSPNIQSSDRKAYEYGADIRFLNNRIGLDVTRYHYLNTGIVSQGTSPASGYSSYLTNGNTYTNNGWEVVINANPLKNPHGLNWNVTANWFTYIRKWVSDANPDNYSHNGTRIDLVYGNGFIRTPDGKFVIDPVSGLQIIDAELGSSALRVFGHSDPDWQWGIVNNFSYKGFSFRFQFDGSVGGVIEDGVRKKSLQGGRQIETVQGKFGAARPADALANSTTKGTYIADGVNLSGAAIQIDPATEEITNMKNLTETTNTTPTTVQGYVSNMAAIPDQDIVKKTYGKLREVAITYEIPQSVFGKRSFIQRASFSLVGRNLLYFFPNRFKDFDVDQYQTLGAGTSTLNPNSGTGAGAYTSGLQTPTTRSYGVNLNLTF